MHLVENKAALCRQGSPLAEYSYINFM